MTDKPKTIQEALAEVQRNVDQLQEFASTPSTGQKFKSAAKTVAKGAAIGLGAPAIGAGAGYLAGKTAEKLATGTETGRNIGKWIGDNVPGAKTAADALKPTGDAIRTAFGGTPPQRNTPAAETPKTEPAKTETPKTETPPAGSSAAKMSFVDAYNKARQMAKAAGKDPNVAQFKFDRGGGEKVYQAAATKADYVPMSKQFKVDINTPTTKTSDVTPKSVKTTSVQNPVSGPDISSKPGEGTKYPADGTGVTPSAARDVSGSEGAKYPASGGVRQSTGTFEKGPGYAVIREPKTESGGKKKVSEEYINEAPYGAPGLVGTGNMNRTGGGTITTAPRPTPRPTNLPSSSTTSAKPAKPMMGTASDFASFKANNHGATYGQYLNTIRGLTAKKGGANDPDVIQRRMNADAVKKGPVAPQKAWDPDSIKTPSSRPPVNTTPSKGSTANLNAPGRGPSDRIPAILQDRGSDPKTSSADAISSSGMGVGGGSTQAGVRAVAADGDGVGRSGSPDIFTSKDRDMEREVSGGDPTPKGGYRMDQPRTPRSNEAQPESGGKKKVSEENNPLIAMFLKLQEKNTLTPNIFEAAKKAKKDYDGDGNIESPKDEVWGSRFLAAKKAGKMEEGVKADPNDPSYQGGGDVTSTPEKKTSMPKPTAPKTDSSVQGSGDVTMNGKPARVKEEAEVTFSQAEIDHINSFFLEASVAPTRAEVATGADSTSDKMSQNDVTVTAESGKKIRKEETQIDEHKSMDGDPLKVGDSVGFKDGHEQYGKIHSISPQGHAKVKVWDSEAGEHYHVTKHVSRLWKETNEEVEIQEGRPKKNPTPETTERDARKHIQVEAGRAAGGNVIDFKHDDGKVSKLTPGMGRRITAHLNGLKPAERQEAVKKMHASPEGLKV